MSAALFFAIAFELYLVVATTYMFLAPEEKQILKLQKRRPEWGKARWRQFFYIFRGSFVVVTVGFSYYLFTLWHGGPQ